MEIESREPFILDELKSRSVSNLILNAFNVSIEIETFLLKKIKKRNHFA